VHVHLARVCRASRTLHVARRASRTSRTSRVEQHHASCVAHVGRVAATTTKSATASRPGE